MSMSSSLTTYPKSHSEYIRICQTLLLKNFKKTFHGTTSSIFRKDNATVQVSFPPKNK